MKTAIVRLRVTPEEVAEWQAAAKAGGVTLSVWIRRAVEGYRDPALGAVRRPWEGPPPETITTTRDPLLATAQAVFREQVRAQVQGGRASEPALACVHGRLRGSGCLRCPGKVARA
jgi:Mobilization protein NikA